MAVAAPRPPLPAHLAVRERLDALSEFPPDEAAWLPSRVLGAVAAHTGALPAATPPRHEEGRWVWSLVAQPGGERLVGACGAPLFADGRLACAVDRVQWAGAERERVAVGWRAPELRPTVSLIQPLRALSRLGEGICLVSAQHTLRTVDLTVRAPGHESLGRVLATLVVAPGMSGLILVRMESVGGAVQALLSWPSERLTDPTLDLADDRWPTRCEGASRPGPAAAAGTLPTVLRMVRGRVARGAVLALGRQAWFVTEGDALGDGVVRAVNDGVVEFARGPRVIRLPAPPATSRPALDAPGAQPHTPVPPRAPARG